MKSLAFVLFFVSLTVGCAAPAKLISIQVTPATATVDVGATVQFTAIGTYSHGGHPTTTKNVTDQVTWASVETSVATINSAGLATGAGSGTTSITATASSSSGPVTGTASLSVQ
jgi:uncharacterized protein YjdB